MFCLRFGLLAPSTVHLCADMQRLFVNSLHDSLQVLPNLAQH
jgi:hypothetical protein